MTPAEHEAAFSMLALNLTRIANGLLAEHGHRFPQQDIGRAFIVPGLALMTGATSPEVVAQWLHQLADQLAEAGRLDAGGLPPMPAGHA